MKKIIKLEALKMEYDPVAKIDYNQKIKFFICPQYTAENNIGDYRLLVN